MPNLGVIVEGQSEVESVPVLLRRMLDSLNAAQWGVERPFRVKRTGVVREGEIERALAMLLRSRRDLGGILVLLDSDDDCAADLGPRLTERCRAVTSLPCAVVLAVKEFECWFLGAKESLRGRRGIRPDAVAPPEPENIRGAKGRLTANMMDCRYMEVDDQAALADAFDLDEAATRCPSFERFRKVVSAIVAPGQVRG
jgi:hypothetical protein